MAPMHQNTFRKTLLHLVQKRSLQQIIPQKRRLKPQDHLVYFWPLQSWGTFESCSGQREAVRQEAKEEGVRNRNTN